MSRETPQDSTFPGEPSAQAAAMCRDHEEGSDNGATKVRLMPCRQTGQGIIAAVQLALWSMVIFLDTSGSLTQRLLITGGIFGGILVVLGLGWWVSQFVGSTFRSSGTAHAWPPPGTNPNAPVLTPIESARSDPDSISACKG